MDPKELKHQLGLATFKALEALNDMQLLSSILWQSAIDSKLEADRKYYAQFECDANHLIDIITSRRSELLTRGVSHISSTQKRKSPC